MFIVLFTGVVMQLWGTGTRAPSTVDFQLFNFSGHFRAAQTLTFDSDSRKKYTGLWLCHRLLHEVHNIFVCHP